jgi:hypothetical protein
MSRGTLYEIQIINDTCSDQGSNFSSNLENKVSRRTGRSFSATRIVERSDWFLSLDLFA